MKSLLLQGDCYEQLDKLEDESVGSVVADPPYLIDFMNKGWDSADNIAASPELYKKLFTKMKHGGYVALFGHSRTHHRIMVALEEAGFELKDTLTWLYGQGFPKSHNISISIDKKLKGMKARGTRTNFGTTMLTTETMDKDKDGKVIPRGTGAPKHEPMCEESKKWEGYGTALKPAVEFIVLAQKPRKGTYANNCLTYGVGGLNIDECRVGYESTPNAATNPLYRKENGYKTPAKGQESNGAVSFTSSNNDAKTEGRFPANLILSHSEGCVKVGEGKEDVIGGNKGKSGFAAGYESGDFTKEEKSYDVYDCDDDCAVRLLNEQSGTTKSSKRSPKHNKKTEHTNTYTPNRSDYRDDNTYSDSGGAGRFFKTTEAPEGRFPANLILSHSDGCEKVGETTIGKGKTTEGSASGGIWNPSTGKPAGRTYGEENKEVYVCEDDCPVRMLDEQAPAVGNAFKAKRKKDTSGGSGDSWTNGGKKSGETNGTYDGLSGASRFFYCAKVSKKERNFGVGHRDKKSAELRSKSAAGLWEAKGYNKPQHNHHPTLKPIALMRWLVRLITPPEETCLDLFMGAGSTGGACVKENRDFIGIELDNDYFSIAADRIAAWQEEADE